MNNRLNVVTRNPVVGEKPVDLPQHDSPEGDAEVNEERYVDRLEKCSAEPLKSIDPHPL
jgi:hypothetical protein